MIRGTARILRYGRSWLTGRARVEERTLELDRSDRTVSASLFLPEEPRPSLPAWVVLHGVTRRGRRHGALQRFVRALAASQAAVVVPEVPEWIELELAPGVTGPSVRASIDALRATGLVDVHAPIGLIGFSFGAPQGLVASTDPAVAGDLDAVVGFGGYCDLERTVRFQLTGRHEWHGREHRLRPDPYGRWIVAANFLTRVPGYEEFGDVATGLRDLAKEAGDRGAMALDPVYDTTKARLRASVAGERRGLFDLFAPPSDRDPDPDRAEEWVPRLVETAQRAQPRMDPAPWLDRVRVPAHLLHGRGDQLIPFTETLRLAEALPDGAVSRVTITGLFSHSSDATVTSWPGRVKEAVAFGAALNAVLCSV